MTDDKDRIRQLEDRVTKLEDHFNMLAHAAVDRLRQSKKHKLVKSTDNEFETGQYNKKPYNPLEG